MESTIKLSDELKEKIKKRYFLLTYNGESGDTYHFLFKNKDGINAELFLEKQLPWECDEYGVLYGVGWSWEHLEVWDEEKEADEGPQEADASSS